MVKRFFSGIWDTVSSRDFWRGYCQAFDLFPTKLDDYPHENEAEAIRADWKAVGDNMKTVMDELERTIKEKTRS